VWETRDDEIDGAGCAPVRFLGLAWGSEGEDVGAVGGGVVDDEGGTSSSSVSVKVTEPFSSTLIRKCLRTMAVKEMGSGSMGREFSGIYNPKNSTCPLLAIPIR